MIAGVDIGGTNIAAGLVGDDHRVTERTRVRTPSGGPAAIVEAAAKAVASLGGTVDAVGVGVPGPVVGGVVTTAPNLTGFTEPVPFAEMLRRRLRLPVEVGNDANVGTLGEWVAGAARGARFVLGVWMGTGVGGGLVLDGRPYVGAFGGAGEFGHMCVRQGGALCGCGRRGCIEAYAGRGRMEETVRTAAAAGHRTRLYELAGERGKDRLTSGVWRRALELGDPLATRVFDDAIDAVAAGIGAAINLLDLDRVVVGGGMTEKLGPPLADRIASTVRPYLFVPAEGREVVTAELGDDSGVIGAAALAREAGATG
jgi:glucokinase